MTCWSIDLFRLLGLAVVAVCNKTKSVVVFSSACRARICLLLDCFGKEDAMFVLDCKLVFSRALCFVIVWRAERLGGSRRSRIGACW